MDQVFTAGYLFCGSGLGALGSDAAELEINGRRARFENVGGVDFDEESCADFRRLTGGRALCADIGRMRPRELRAFFGERAPHLFKWSPPCKGASQLLSKEASQTAKYQDMNRLALKALRKVLAAWPRREERPLVIVVENVPSFRSRCRKVLQEMVRLLRRAGYAIDMRTHDLGEEGGLAQRRERFTLAARLVSGCPAPVELPPRKRLRGVGEVLAPLPWPDDPRMGPLHRMPAISWLNAVRLALIPPGGDWRDLPKRGSVAEWLGSRGLWPVDQDTAAFRTMVEEKLGGPLKPGQPRREVHRRHPVASWEEPSATVSGPGGAGPCAAGDQRLLDLALGHSPRRGAAGVTGWESVMPTVRGVSKHQNGAAVVADERALEALSFGSGQRAGSTGVYDWGSPARTVIGTPYVSGGSAPGSVADPRTLDALAMGADNRNRHTSKYAVGEWEDASRTVTGAQQIGSGGPAISDPRMLDVLAIGKTADGAEAWKGRPGFMGLGDWQEPSPTVVGRATVSGGHAQAALADPRVRERVERLGLGCRGRNGFYGVLDWNAVGTTVTGSLQLDNGPAAVADSRSMPEPRMVIDIHLALQLLAEGWEVPKGMLAPAIISPLSGCWHRPLTTMELAVIQGLPWWMGDGPLRLAGKSDRRWRERIGNGIPVGGAEAWGRSVLEALVRSSAGEGWRLCGNGQWVLPEVILLEAV